MAVFAGNLVCPTSRKVVEKFLQLTTRLEQLLSAGVENGFGDQMEIAGNSLQVLKVRKSDMYN